jgi:hypothetical protein
MAKATGLDVDMTQFKRFLSTASDALQEGAKKGVEKALEVWQLEATNIAPIGRYDNRRGGNLRANIQRKKPIVRKLNIDGMLVVKAFNNGFNYGYFVHNIAPEKGYEAKTPGTTLEFLTESRDANKLRLERIIVNEIQAELQRRRLT